MWPHESGDIFTAVEGLNEFDGLSETTLAAVSVGKIWAMSFSVTDPGMEHTTFPKHAVPMIQGGSPSLHVFNAIEHFSFASSKLKAQ